MMVGKNSEVFEIYLDKDFGPTNILEVGTFKVIIAGGRDFQDVVKLTYHCDNLLANKGSVEIVSGTARGADKLGEDYADNRRYPIKRFPADWNKFGRSAGPIRNAEMAKYADALIAFWDGKSKGTENMIETARKMGLGVRIIKY